MRTFRTIPTIRTIRTRLRQAAPWQATRTTWNGARVGKRLSSPFHRNSGGPTAYEKMRQHFYAVQGILPCPGFGAGSPMHFPAAVPTTNGRARDEREPPGKTRTYRTIPTIRTIRTIRTRLRQAAPWQAARKPWNGARVRETAFLTVPP